MANRPWHNPIEHAEEILTQKTPCSVNEGQTHSGRSRVFVVSVHHQIVLGVAVLRAMTSQIQSANAHLKDLAASEAGASKDVCVLLPSSPAQGSLAIYSSRQQV